MQPSNHYDIVIVGAGPAGLGTALHLAQRYPRLAGRTVVLEAATHPRRKICGGAVTVHGEQQLAALGVQAQVPAAAVHRLRFRFGRYGFTVDHPHVMRVVQRADFDAALAQAAQQRGIELRCDERLIDVQVVADGVELTTTRDRYHARVVVAADGAKSIVRQRLGVRSPLGVARLLQVLMPVDPATSVEFAEQAATFDFSCVSAGVQGYLWDFPCIIDGQTYLNRGIFDARIAPLPQARLKDVFTSSLAARGVASDAMQVVGYPVRWFNPQAEFARPHVVLVGDAAGVDPIFAEGISYALEYGAIAADAVGAAFEQQDFRFADYRARILRHDLGRMLSFKAGLAQRMYGRPRPRIWALIWQLATIAPRPITHAVGRALGVLPSSAAVPLPHPRIT